MDEKDDVDNFMSAKKVEVDTMRTEQILDTLMPPLVVQELRNLPLNDAPNTHKYRHATIAQSDLCGFTQLASTCTPEEVVKFMGELFGEFDMLTDKYGIYKVETIGDAYIAGMAEQPLTLENLPTSVVRFGLDMVKAVDIWSQKLNETKLKATVRCRVGVAYGDCIGGVVGKDMRRYHLFGDLLSVMDILEATSEEGCVQVSQQCRDEVIRMQRASDELQASATELVFEERQEGSLKTSKGEAHTFEEVGGKTYIVIEALRCQR